MFGEGVLFVETCDGMFWLTHMSRILAALHDFLPMHQRSNAPGCNLSGLNIPNFTQNLSDVFPGVYRLTRKRSFIIGVYKHRPQKFQRLPQVNRTVARKLRPKHFREYTGAEHTVNNGAFKRGLCCKFRIEVKRVIVARDAGEIDYVVLRETERVAMNGI